MPVEFLIPSDEPTSDDVGDPTVTWTLKFRTRGLWLGPTATFDLPVFDVPDDEIRGADSATPLS